MKCGRRFRPVLSVRTVDPAYPVRKPAAWKMERSGEFGEFAVSGWRYHGLAIWHVKLWSKNNEDPERSYTVTAGAFYPQTVAPSEKFAVLRLLALWEADGLA